MMSTGKWLIRLVVSCVCLRDVAREFGSRWFHGADDFLEKARVIQMRLTTVYHQIRNIKVRK